MPILSKQNNSLAGCPFERANGRGGIRTHGGFPHARFRVECLKPASATLPIARYCPRYFATRNRQTALSLQRQSEALQAAGRRIGLRHSSTHLPSNDEVTVRHGLSVNATAVGFVAHIPKQHCKHCALLDPILLSAFAD